MSGKKWFASMIIMCLAALLVLSGCVFWTDPFFHYRSPRDYFYYDLEEQRYQNDGITRHFDYDAIITGTSMCENFSASEFDSVFGTNSIKVTFSGATYKEIEENLRAVGLGENFDTPVKELSGGMKRRVALVRAIVSKGELLILDEPFKGLDDATRGQVADYLLKGRKKRTVIMVTHDPDEVNMLGGTLTTL